MGELVHGTSSWSEKSWVGSFYPAGTQPGDFLALYSQQFPAVEADVTYYRIPDRRLVESWGRKTPDGFTICAKFPRSIVHAGKDRQPDTSKLLVPPEVAADLDRFLEAMSVLGPKLGPLLLQFPYFNKKAFRSAGPFVERLDGFLSGLPHSFDYAVEIRNKWWVTEELLGVLRSHGVAFVLVDQLYMPHPADLADGLDLVTTDFSYARLIGDRKAVEKLTDRFDEVVVDQSARLDKWADLLAEVTARVPQTYVFTNNHYAGHGPATVRTLVDMLEV